MNADRTRWYKMLGPEKLAANERAALEDFKRSEEEPGRVNTPADLPEALGASEPQGPGHK